MHNLKEILKDRELKASSPCRIDFAGTLDIPTFSFPLADLCPVTFNMALNLRTYVKLRAHEKENYIKVISKGFEPAEFESKKAPYDHPLGLIFAIADSFNVGGVEIEIESNSPPRSALGGSSVASVALTALLMRELSAPENKVMAKDAALTAHYIESAVAGVPCGLQDHLAAAYGGANAWHWNSVALWPEFQNTTLVPRGEYDTIKDNFLVAYTGKIHDSHSVNTRWREQFVRGEFREHWKKIAVLSHEFCTSFLEKDFTKLADIVRQEVDLRKDMTPDVLDDSGLKLVSLADSRGCGGRFTGAGGGGCVWAVGSKEKIGELRKDWEKALENIEDGRILDVLPDPSGILFEDNN